MDAGRRHRERPRRHVWVSQAEVHAVGGLNRAERALGGPTYLIAATREPCTVRNLGATAVQFGLHFNGLVDLWRAL